MRLLLGDCLDKLKELDDNSVDSIVTDPPYGLSFMGKTWDYDVPKKKIWKECMRVLKPGGYLLAFAGSRTYHRMAIRIEDAGFEIRDQIMWIYGSGFPKSLNIGKQIDKIGGESISWFIDYVLDIMEERGITMQDMTKLMPSKTGKPTGWWYNKAKYKSGLTLEQFNLIKTALNLPFDDLEETKREVLGKLKTNLGVMQNIGGDYTPGEIEVTKGNSEWEGWGTALKPAHEPIVMARKPLSKKTVVDNVLEWGTGGINIDESRIGTEIIPQKRHIGNTFSQVYKENNKDTPDVKSYENLEWEYQQGRFPANIIFDEEAGKILDEQTGILKSGNLNAGHKRGVGTGNSYANGGGGGIIDRNYGGDEGGASRFFYCPKTSKTDRNEGLDGFEEKRKSHITSQNFENALTGGGNTRNPYSKNNHPTVKPTDLMLYLIRLVTPKGGTTLDPFMGSGSTGKAAVRGGFDFVGIEREKEYMEIATARIQYEKDNPYDKQKNKRVKINKSSKKFW